MNLKHVPRSIKLLAISTLIGWGISKMFEESNLIEATNRAGYEAFQRELLKQEPVAKNVRIVDLSALIQKRGTGELAPGSAEDRALATQFVGIAAVLKEVTRTHPKAIFVDWVLTLPDNFRQPNADHFEFAPGVSPELQANYKELVDQIEAIQPTCQVFFLGRVDSLKGAGPWSRSHSPLVSGDINPEVTGNKLAPYESVAPIQSGPLSQVPFVTDAIISRLSLPDKVKQQSTTGLVFGAIAPSPSGQSFWVNYGFSKDLAAHGYFGDFTHLHDAASAEQLDFEDKVVVLCDLTEPDGTDKLPLPFESDEIKGTLPDGTSIELSGSGGLYHACALSTRTAAPLYALKPGWAEFAFFAFWNLLVWLFYRGIAKLIKDKAPKEHHIRLEVIAELALMIGVTALVIMVVPGVYAARNIMIPQIAPFLAMRGFDVIGTIIALSIPEKETSEPRPPSSIIDESADCPEPATEPSDTAKP